MESSATEGVWVRTDRMAITRFDELGSPLVAVLGAFCRFPWPGSDTNGLVSDTGGSLRQEPIEGLETREHVLSSMTEEWKAAIRQNRTEKDEYFGSNPHSPIPPADRDSFEGLSYYPIDESYRFELPLDEYDDPEAVTVGTSTGGERDYLRWGEFRFEVDGQHVTIQAYKSDPHDDRLWVPFRDETSGEATYGAGRYLDLERHTHRTGDGSWILDFNEAYNPTCAYSDQYECPLPPTENWLDVPIAAGEKAYKSDADH